MSNDFAKLINGPADEKIASKQKPFNCPINGCTKSFTRHGHLSRHVQSCQSKRNRKENEKPVHPPSPVTSYSCASSVTVVGPSNDLPVEATETAVVDI
ncbi:hypothetical protein RhiirB3_528369 [Rhizophagus irregularis]|nr:hypothetical protein RhiirB3_528369 [Rhizophagus irregularis]